jgi:enediyne biosynthesis protein E4
MIDDSLPGQIASTGPLALADVDGDGDLDLFVGGRVNPGRYPEAASSRLFRFDGKQFQLDTNNSKALENIGLVTAAVFSDLDGDGLPELILACEWGPLKIFRNAKGKLVAWDPPVTLWNDPQHTTRNTVPSVNSPASTLSELTGWWNGVTTGDLDGDGRLDIIAANWGLNSEYTTSRERPLQLYYGDLLDRGVVDLLETEWDPLAHTFAPRRRLDVLGRGLPVLSERFASHRAYSEASMADILRPYQGRSRKVEATTLASMIFFNRGDHFEAVPLPREAQWAPVFGVTVADFDGDGHEDVFLGQNFFATQPEMPRLDAGRGLLLRGDGAGKLEAVPGQQSGIEVYGEQRGTAVADFDGDGRADLVVTQNGAATRLFHNRGAKPGLRVRLAGPELNPGGVGAMLRVKFGSRLGPAREIHAGSGYCSQDGAVQVLGLSEVPSDIWVRWPGGATSNVAVPPNAMEITVTSPAR